MATWTTISGSGADATTTYTTADGTVITVKGVSATGGLAVDETSHTVTVSSSSLGTNNVSISVAKEGGTGTEYTLALGSDTKTVASGNAAWALSGTTATYEKSATTNYTLAADGKTITYLTEAASSPVVYATITGVNSKLAVDNDADATAANLAAAFKIKGNEITVNKSAIDNTSKSTELTLTNGANESGTTQTFTLALGEDVNESTYKWIYSGTKAEYKETAPIQFKVEGTKIKASSTKAQTSTIATVSGIVKGAESGLEASEDGKTITISTDLFGTSKITLKNGKYVDKSDAEFEFVVSGDYTNSKGEAVAPVWIVKGTTAQYYDKNSLQSKWGYNVGKTDIEYTKPQTKKGATAAITLTNLKSDKLVPGATGQIKGITVTAADYNKDGSLKTEGTVAISKELFNEKNISLTGDDYSLAFVADEVTADAEEAETAGTDPTFYSEEDAIDGETYKITCPTETDAKGKAEIMQVVHKGYTLSSNAKAILYGTSDPAKVKIAEVAGLDKKGGEGISFDSETGAVSLTEDVIGASKKITISGDAGYTLALSGIDEPTKGDVAWDLTKTTATYKAVTPAGYVISDDGKTITASKETADVTATVNGLNAGLATLIISNIADFDEMGLSGLTEVTESAIKKTDAYKAIATELTAENEAKTEGKLDAAALKAAIAEAQKDFVEEAIAIYKEAVADTDGEGGLNNYVKIDTDAKTITLEPEALGTSKVTVKSTDGYKLALGEDVLDSEAKAKEAQGLMWSVSGATATYQEYRPAYYTIDSKGAVNCTKGAPVDKKAAPTIVLNGLKKNLVVDSDGAIAGITIDAATGTVTLTDDVLAETNVKVTKGTYKIKLSTENIASASAVWAKTKKTDSFDLTLEKTSGYELAADGKSVTYVKKDAKPSKIGTISGLSGTLTADEGSLIVGEDAVITVDEDNKKIVISDASVLSAVTDKKKVTFSGKEYALALSSDVAGAADYEDHWIVDAKKKTASLRRTITSDGLAVDATGKTIVQMKTGDKSATFDLFTITGLKSEFIAKALEAAEYEVASDATDEAKAAAATAAQAAVNTLFTDETDGILSIGTDNSIVLKEGALGSSAVKLATKGNYTLDLDEGVAQTAGTTATQGFVISGTTATYKDINTGYFTLDAKGTSVAYVAPKSAADSKIFTITGLAKGLTVDASGKIAGINVSGVQVTISAAALGTTDVALTDSTEFKFKLDSDVKLAAAASDPVWTVKKTSATLTQEPAQGYTLKDNQNITYTKGGSAETLATLSGLASTLEAKLGDDKTLTGTYVEVDDDAKTISLNKALLEGTTSVKLKNGKNATYKLVVGDDAKVSSATSKSVQWYINNTTAQYINCENEHYDEVSTAAKTAGLQIDLIKASPVDGATAEITVEGIKKGTTAAGIAIDSTNKVVKIADAALNKKAITLTTPESGTYKDYKLAFSGETELNNPVVEASWSISSSTAKLNQDLEKGYTPSSDGKSISYLGSNKKVAVATVKGVKDTPADDIKNGSTVLTLKGDSLTNKVSVDGAGYTFTFDKNYAAGGAITGSKNDDKITINSAGITVTGGKGADTIDLGSATRTTTGESTVVNTLFYASGDSPEAAGDVIKNYKAGDVIKFNLKGTAFTAAAAADGDNVVVTLTKLGSKPVVDKITLTGAAIANVAVVDKDNKAVTVDGVPAATTTEASGVGADIGDLLYSDNYNLGAQLGEIMSGNSITDFSVGELDTDSATALTKQQPTIVASTGK